MKTNEEFKKQLKPFLEMIMVAKSENNTDFLVNVEEFKKLLIIRNICGISENQFLLDKFVDEILEQE
jgi:hypothetical protein